MRGTDNLGLQSDYQRSRHGVRSIACIVTLIAAILLFLLVLAAIVARAFIIQSFYVPSGSMEPAYPKGSILLISALAYRTEDPQRFDVAVFKFPPQPHVRYLKRVIGLPGETVEIRSGSVLIDSKPVKCEFFKEPPSDDYGPEKVPPDCYFVIGDNADHSSDSRVWGFVPRQNFVGKVVAFLSRPAP